MPHTPTPPNKDAMPPERPSPRTVRRAAVILGILAAIIAVLYVGMNISQVLSGPAVNDEPEARTGP